MSDNFDKSAKYFKRKRYNKNKNDSDESIRSSSNYQRLLSNSSKSESKNYTSQNNPVILKYANGGETNLLTWLERIGTILIARYGNSAKFVNGEAYKRKLPSLDVYDNVSDPSGVLRKVQETHWVEYVKAMARLREDKSKIWGDMELYMSKESLDAVKAKPEYETLKESFKVIGFLKLIKKVHRTEQAVRSSVDAVADALEEFHSIKQNTDESLIDYKNRIVAAVERIETADPTQKPDNITVARKFTRSLDLNRFEELVIQCREDESKYKPTLSDAHNQASQQCTAVKGKLVPCETLKRNSNVAGAATIKGLSKKEYKLVMAMRKDEKVKEESTDGKPTGKGKKRTADDANLAAAANDNNKKYKKTQPNNGNVKETEGGCCSICNKSNHTTENCFYLNKCRDMVAQQRTQRQQQFANNSGGGYQPQYQTNYGYGPSPNNMAPGRQVTYGNANNNSSEVNYGYSARNTFARPFNQS